MLEKHIKSGRIGYRMSEEQGNQQKEVLIYVDNKTKEIKIPTVKKKLQAFYETFYKQYINLAPIDSKSNLEFFKSQFYQYIKEKLNSSIYGKKDNIILFLGAGASVLGNEWKYGKTMAYLAYKIIKDIYFDNTDKYIEDEANNPNNLLSFAEVASLSNLNATDILSKLDKNFATEKNQSSKNEESSDSTQSSKKESDFDLEGFMSTLNLISSLKKKKLKMVLDSDKNSGVSSSFVTRADATRIKFQKKISDMVQYNNYPFDSTVDEKFYHLAIMKQLMKWIDKKEGKLEVVTTNYDRVIEKAAEKGNLIVFDGFGFNIDASFDDNWFDWNLSKNVKGLSTNEIEYNPNIIDLLKIHGSIDWFAEKNNEDQGEKIVKRKGDIDKQVMIFPSSDKYRQSYDKPYFELLSRFQNMLHRPNSLLITSGFSFGDKHISRMIYDAVKENNSLRVVVTDYNIENESFNTIRNMISNGYNISLLKAAMNGNDSEYGLYFYLR